MPLQVENKKGAIVIPNEVLAKIAGIAATHCYGVVGMAGRKGAGGVADLLFGDAAAKGVKISATKDNHVSIELHVILSYGININTTCNSIIKDVKYNVEAMTGFSVGQVNVCVDGIRTSDE